VTTTARRRSVPNPAGSIRVTLLGAARALKAGAGAVRRPRRRIRKSRLEVGTALPQQARQVHALVNIWADRGLTIHRSREDVERCIGEFVSVTDGRRLAGCGCLSVISPSLAEIRSVSVNDRYEGCGVGRMIVEGLLDRAEALELDHIVLVTKIPAFFARFGFIEVPHHELPPMFVEEAILARGRTLDGRITMSKRLY